MGQQTLIGRNAKNGTWESTLCQRNAKKGYCWWDMQHCVYCQEKGYYYANAKKSKCNAKQRLWCNSTGQLDQVQAFCWTELPGWVHHVKMVWHSWAGAPCPLLLLMVIAASGPNPWFTSIPCLARCPKLSYWYIAPQKNWNGIWWLTKIDVPRYGQAATCIGLPPWSTFWSGKHPRCQMAFWAHVAPSFPPFWPGGGRSWWGCGGLPKYSWRMMSHLV